jgi:hypothetical protein
MPVCLRLPCRPPSRGAAWPSLSYRAT